MTNLRRFALVAAFFALASVGPGQRLHEAVLKRLSFLSGNWVSETPEEVQEEIWSPVSGNSLMGSFRIVKHGRPVFYEFWAVELDDHGPVLKLKHFNANLVGWEEKNASIKLPLVTSAENDAVFAEASGMVSLHYHRTGNKLSCTVHHVQDGKQSDETFALTRVPGK